MKGKRTWLYYSWTKPMHTVPYLGNSTLEQDHVLSNIKDLIMDYYDNFNLRFTSGTIKSEWHQLEKGIITGYTISVSLFSLAMKILIKLAEGECRGPITKSGVQQPPISTFMNDLTVKTQSVPGTRWILQGLVRIITWVRMCFSKIQVLGTERREGD